MDQHTNSTPSPSTVTGRSPVSFAPENLGRPTGPYLGHDPDESTGPDHDRRILEQLTQFVREHRSTTLPADERIARFSPTAPLFLQHALEFLAAKVGPHTPKHLIGQWALDEGMRRLAATDAYLRIQVARDALRDLGHLENLPPWIVRLDIGQSPQLNMRDVPRKAVSRCSRMGDCLGLTKGSASSASIAMAAGLVGVGLPGHPGAKIQSAMEKFLPELAERAEMVEATLGWVRSRPASTLKIVGWRDMAGGR